MTKLLLLCLCVVLIALFSSACSSDDEIALLRADRARAKAEASDYKLYMIIGTVGGFLLGVAIGSRSKPP